MLNFNEDDFASFILDYFYYHCFRRLETFFENNELRQQMAKARQVLGSLRDVLKYPKLSSGHLASMSLDDIDRLLFRRTDDIERCSFDIRIYAGRNIQETGLVFETSKPVQSLVLQLRSVASQAGVDESLLQQYGLFLAFADDTPDIALPFDAQ